jgi:hypothetical protein
MIEAPKHVPARGPQVGTLVKWFETYDCDTIVYDVGVGIVVDVIEATETVFNDWHAVKHHVPVIRYRIYRTKHCDQRVFHARDVELI